jgi:hypothetical protein
VETILEIGKMKIGVEIAVEVLILKIDKGEEEAVFKIEEEEALWVVEEETNLELEDLMIEKGLMIEGEVEEALGVEVVLTEVSIEDFKIEVEEEEDAGEAVLEMVLAIIETLEIEIQHILEDVILVTEKLLEEILIHRLKKLSLKILLIKNLQYSKKKPLILQNYQ